MTGPVAAAGAVPGSAQRRTLSGTFWGALAEGTALPAGLVLVGFLTRRLGPGGYGAYGLAAAMVVRVEACLNAFLARATSALVSRADDRRPVATMALRLGLGAGLWVVAKLVIIGLRVVLGFVFLGGLDGRERAAARAALGRPAALRGATGS